MSDPKNYFDVPVDVANAARVVELFFMSQGKKHWECGGLASRDSVKLLRDALAGIVGASDREELRQMEAAVRMLPAPEQGKAETLNAIHALRAIGGTQ